MQTINKINQDKKTTIAITGATGLLGRNILFEYLKQYQSDLNNISIILLGRDSKKSSLKERVKEIFLNDGRFYLDIEDEKISIFLDYLNKKVIYININLEKNELDISSRDLNLLLSMPLDIFYHAGADTSLVDTDVAKDQIHNANIIGTQRVLDLLSKLSLERLCYFSSAYATGILSEKVLPDDLSLNRNFRNPYEYSKLKAEILVRNFEKESGINSYIFRVSLLSGRLIEKEIGQTHKFDIFYAWTQFFIKAKHMLLPKGSDIYNTPIKMNIRIFGSKKSGMNILPVDYAAKASIDIMSSKNIKFSAFHLVNHEETIFPVTILDFLNIEGYKGVDTIPEDLNKLEKIYYRSVGKLFNGYINNGEMYFDTTSLDESLSKNIKCPYIDKEKFISLLEYAKKKNFGLG